MALNTVQHLGVEYSEKVFARALEESEEARLLYDTLVEYGLDPQPERSHLFNVFSPESLQTVLISITPFTTKDLRQEAGLSVSAGGHAQAVVVDIEEHTKITRFTHLAVSGDEVVRSSHSVDELNEGRETRRSATDHVRALAEGVGKVRTRRPLVEITSRQVRSLATIAYSSLLGDDFSRTVHDEQEITYLRESTNIVAEIGLFVLFRTQGSSCCSCSCSCWGSSSCSSSYISN